VGRPTKLTKARAERIVAAVGVGAPRHVAAQSAGIARSTLQQWLARGESSNAPQLYRRFAEDLREAEAGREVEALQNIAAAAREDWRADAWYLTHARDGYSKRHELSGPAGGPIAVEGTWDLSKLTERELVTLQALAEKAERGDG